MDLQPITHASPTRYRRPHRHRSSPTRQTIIPRTPLRPPQAISIPAMLAPSAWRAFGMEFCIVVEGNLVLAVGVAEDMAAVAAVVAAFEKVKVFVACRGVADGGLGVGLPVRAAGGAFDWWEVGVVFFVVVIVDVDEGLVFGDLV